MENKPLELIELEFISSVLDSRKGVNFKSILSPKLREIYEKMEIFEMKISQVKNYLKYNTEPPAILVAELISISEDLLDDISFIIKSRIESEEELKEFEKSMKNLRSRLDKQKETLFSLLPKKDKLSELSIYIEMCTSIVRDYIRQVFIDFRDSLSLISDVWKPMEKKFSDLLIKRMGIFPEEEEKKKRGEEEL